MRTTRLPTVSRCHPLRSHVRGYPPPPRYTHPTPLDMPTPTPPPDIPTPTPPSRHTTPLDIPTPSPGLPTFLASGGRNLLQSGFPPIREFRENFEDFFQSGKNRVFQPKSGKKIWNQGTFFQTIFKPFKPINLRKMFFKSVKLRSCQEIAISA